MVSSPKKLPWIEWLCHSNFSFLTGASHPEDYVERANSLSYRGLGICDFDGLYGIVKAFKTRRKLLTNKEYFVPQVFYGCELHLGLYHKLPVVLRQTIVLYATNLRGYQQLSSILSLAHKDSKTQAYLGIDEISRMPTSDLVCLQPMRGLVRYGEDQTIINHYNKLKEIFSDRFYLIVSRHLNPFEDIWIKPTLKLSSKLGIPTLLSQDCFFHRASEKDLSDLVTAIRLNRTIEKSVAHMFVNDERSLHTLNEIQARFERLPCFKDSLVNSLDLKDRFDFDLTLLRYEYPKEMIPQGYTAQGYLEHLVWQAYKTQQPSDKLKETIIKELQLIRILEFADYFLTVWDIVSWARKQAILCQGRGSAANSAVCFMLGITAIDPSRFNLLFERFLSLERGDPPDIDVDFEHERREEVIQYIYQRYGRSRAAMVANVITFRTRGAIRAVGKALGLSEEVLSHVNNSRKSRSERKEPLQPQKVLGDTIPWELWNHFVERLTGFPRHMGLHSGGFIISEKPLNQIVPQEPATMENRTVVQWAKDDIEELGLFKIDILALGMLSALRKSFKLIENHHGKDVNLKTIPEGDDKTYAMIQRADTVGTFQIESRAQMSMLPRLRPANFYDLVVEIGIIRPGPIQGGLIHPFLKRRAGLEPVVYPHPKLKPILERTKGVPIFQEQVMRVAMAVGDFSPGEADQLRKQVGSWSLNKDMGELVGKFARGMRRNGIAEHHIKQLVDQLKGFANYGFPESHAASFALLAYASCYIKCHYKEAFYVGLLNSQPLGFYSPHALLQSAKREGAKLEPLSLKYSTWDHLIEHKDDGSLVIRLGFRLIKGLSKNGADQLIKRRDTKGYWQDAYDFVQDCPLHRADFTALVAADLLKDFGLDRQQAIWLAAAIPLASLLEPKEAIVLPQESSLQKVEADFEAFGTSLEHHPTTIIKKEYWDYDCNLGRITLSKNINHYPENSQLFVFGMVLVRQQPPTAKGMVFFTLEDESGYINLVLTPQVAKRFAKIINFHGFICAAGKLQKNAESHSILVHKIFQPQKESNVIDLVNRKAQAVRDLPAIQKTPRTRNYM